MNLKKIVTPVKKRKIKFKKKKIKKTILKMILKKKSQIIKNQMMTAIAPKVVIAVRTRKQRRNRNAKITI